MYVYKLCNSGTTAYLIVVYRIVCIYVFLIKLVQKTYVHIYYYNVQVKLCKYTFN